MFENDCFDSESILWKIILMSEGETWKNLMELMTIHDPCI